MINIKLDQADNLADIKKLRTVSWLWHKKESMAKINSSPEFLPSLRQSPAWFDTDLDTRPPK